jgi:glycosyltransferase involved in cell wall biosynthesis
VDDCPLIVYLGLLNSYQGTDLLLDAAALLHNRGVKAHFLLMGFPDQAYREKAAKMGLSDYVSFTGRVDYQEAALLLSAGDLAVSPKIATTEANGKLLNYMACAIPTVAFDTDVNRELLGDHGIYAPLGDVQLFADRICETLDDLAQAKQTGAELRKRADEQHSLHGRAALLEKYYSQLIRH